MSDWSPISWKTRPAAQQPLYRDEGEVARVTEEISKLPPLVTSWEVGALKAQLAKALNNGAASNNGAAPVSDPSPTVAPTVDAAAL